MRAKTILELCFCMTVLAAGRATAAAPTDYLFKLDCTDREYCWNEEIPGSHVPPYGGVFCFDYWYEPDPVPEDPNHFDMYHVPQDLVVYNTIAYTSYCGSLWAYKHSTEWRTAVFSMSVLPPDLIFRMPLHTGDDFFVTDLCGTRELKPTFYVRNVCTFDTHDDWLAYRKSCYGGDDGNGGGNGTQPVPEPATLAMLATGGIGLLGAKVRRKKGRA